MFGLSLYTQERELRDVFERFGPVDEIQVVYDHQTGRSRGFAFVYMRNYEDAVEVTMLVCCGVGRCTKQLLMCICSEFQLMGVLSLTSVDTFLGKRRGALLTYH